VRKKEDYVRRLREDPLYKVALARAENEEQAESIKKLTEAFVLRFGKAIEGLIDRVENEPGFKEKLRKAMIQRGKVVTSGSKSSGSKGG
jgi:hypothetical protein